jgi:hypothetical protein
MGLGRLEKFVVNAVGGEIVISFDNDSFAAFGDRFAIPFCFHSVYPRYLKLSSKLSKEHPVALVIVH